MSLILPVIASAIIIGVIHTIIGPDHYLPFIVMAKARDWSRPKTCRITILCGLGHVGSSILLGVVAIVFGASMLAVLGIDEFRGELAAWALVFFGVAYLSWSLRKEMKNKTHTHEHIHSDGSEHVHEHKHVHEHGHVHKMDSKKNMTPWVLFTIFVLGPCEPLIVLMMYPAIMSDAMGLFLVVLAFSITTVVVMLIMVLGALKGLSYLPLSKIEPHTNSIAGATIALCGVAILFGL
jgi:ABC-type nickel/cobalt efflux system permease component RcnA